MRWTLAGAGGALLVLASALAAGQERRPPEPAAGEPAGGAPIPRSGAEMYGAWCAACHGPRGQGDGESVPTLPSKPRDFSDCRIIGGEADFNVHRAIKEGGVAVGLGETMPAYGEALSDAQIALLVDHLRTFCRDQPRWVKSDVSFPRWLGGDKAFPENEMVVSPLYPTWTAIPQLFWRYDEAWAASVGAFLPMGSGDWRIMGYVTYEYIYPF